MGVSVHRTARSVAWSVVALAAVSLAAVVALLLFTPASDSRVGQAVVTILGILGPVVAGTYSTIRRIEQQQQQLTATAARVEVTGAKVDRLTNHADPAPGDELGR